MEWQPIETAPKDGSIFMVWGYYSTALGGAPTRENVAWAVSSMRWFESSFDRYEEVGDNLFKKVTDNSGYMSSPSPGYGGLRATHWAPLPDGPRVMPETKGLLGLVA